MLKAEKVFSGIMLSIGSKSIREKIFLPFKAESTYIEEPYLTVLNDHSNQNKTVCPA